MKSHLSGIKNLRISACTITKNEEKNIAKNINSIKDYIDEIIIVDTGSTDSTVSIARELGAKVYDYEWCDDFAAAKNAALSHATGDWIIVLDADEFFEGDCASRIREAILKAELNGHNAIGCRMNNYDVNTGETLAEVFTIRILKAGFTFRFAIHEEPYYKNGMSIMTADKSWLTIGHTGYAASLMPDKARRNLAILKREYEKSTDPVYRATCLSYISDACYSLKEYKDCAEYAKGFLAESKKYKVTVVGCETKPYLNILFSLQYLNADKNEIENWVKKFVKDFPDCADAMYWQGSIEYMHFRYKSALKMYEKTFDLIDNYEGTYPIAITSEIGSLYYSYAQAYEGVGDIAKAMEWHFKAYSVGSSVNLAAFNLMRMVKHTPEKDLDAFVEALIKSADNTKMLALMAGLMCNYMTRQLFNCYAVYKSVNKIDTLDAQVSAFLMTGRGEYAAAAKLFLLNYGMNRTSDNAIRCLLFALLSKDIGLITEAKAITMPEHRFALGLEAEVPANLNINETADVYAECARFKGADFAFEYIGKIANRLGSERLIKLARQIVKKNEHETALRVLELAEITPESVFLRGVIYYNLQRFYQSKDLLALSKHMGYNNEEIAELFELSTAAFGEKCTKINTPSDELEQKIEAAMQAEDIGRGSELIEQYRSMYEADADIYSAQVLTLYCGEKYKSAALTAEAGLLKYGEDADLLFNAGCVYQKLNDSDKARLLYERSLAACKDPQVADEIRQALSIISQASP